MNSKQAKLLRVEGLAKSYPARGSALGRTRGWVHAVRAVDLDLRAGETLALVGESGCGKSSVAHCLLGLVPPSAGRASYFPGASQAPVELLELSARAWRPWRRDLQIVFQDALGSLNPRHPVGRGIADSLKVFGLASGRAEVRRGVAAALERVGLGAEFAVRYPHELSGGELQRVALARALAPKPRLLVLDEALSALDLSLQAQMLNLLLDLQRELGLAYLFISHDLSVVRHLADRVAVMYQGGLVEEGTRQEIFDSPAHPYTQALLGAIPRPFPGAAKRTKSRMIGPGEVTSALQFPAGCPYLTRCVQVEAVCHSTPPPVTRLSPSHTAACHPLQQAPIDPQSGPAPAAPGDQGGTPQD